MTGRLLRFFPFLFVLFLTGVAALLAVFENSQWGWALLILGPLSLLGISDYFHDGNVLRRNYPLSFHMRTLVRFLGPFFHSYIVEGDTGGSPYSREIRNMIYARSRHQEGLLSFGSELDFYGHDFGWIHHSVNAKPPAAKPLCVRIGGDQCGHPYNASLLNVSALSFGALGARAVEALNLGAKLGGFAQDTGEGGFSKYHRVHGGDIIWEVGTGYFGCRTESGGFDTARFADAAQIDQVKMVELKISQGAKPGVGGIVPGAKMTKEVAEARGVPVGQDCVSPGAHSVYSTPVELLEFIARMRDLSGGKPAGFKLCIGHPWEFFAICKAMLETGIRPDFIVVDGAEGGTGAAPVEFPDHVGMPLVEGLSLVHSALVGVNLRDDIRLGASGKVADGYSMVKLLALGADWCNAGRAFMFALGCIQSQRCHTGTCPTGITTHDPLRQRAIVIEEAAKRVSSYHEETMSILASMIGAAGLDDPGQLRPHHVYRRLDPARIDSADHVHHWLAPGQLLEEPGNTAFAEAWRMADPYSFTPRLA